MRINKAKYGIIATIFFAVGLAIYKIMQLKDCEYVTSGNIKEL